MPRKRHAGLQPKMFYHQIGILNPLGAPSMVGLPGIFLYGVISNVRF